MWSDNFEIASTLPQPPTMTELDLVQQIRDRIHDLNINDDYLQPKNIVRFIRARSGSLNQTEQMIRKNIEWMQQEHINEIVDFQFPSVFEEWFPWKVTGLDEFGGPIIIMQAGVWEPGNIFGMKNDLVQYFIHIMEKVHRFITARSKQNNNYIPQFSLIVDCLGLGWKHYISVDGIQAAVTALRIVESNYPDTLRLGMTVNCSFVLNMIWKIVRPLVSASTQAKLRFLYEDDRQVWKEMLTKYFPEDRFPVAYGGTLPDTFKISLELKKQSGQDGDENGNNN